MFRSYRHRWCYHFGVRFLRQEAWQKAESLFRRAADLKPDHSWSHNNLAIALLKLGRFEESCAEFRRAIQLNPDFAESHENLGAALVNLNRWEEAVAVYRRALVLDPKRRHSLRNLGHALFRLERWAEAAIALQDAVELDPTEPLLCRMLGAAYFRAENWERAASAYFDSLALDPSYSDAYSAFATVLTRLKPSEEAQERYREMMALAPNNLAARIGLGVELLKLRRWEEAVSCLQSDRSLAAAEVTCQFLLVDPLFRLGRLDEAAAAYRRAVQLGGSLPALPGGSVASRFKERQNAYWSQENFPPQVFRISSWLEQLVDTASHSSPADLEPPRRGRLLFVLDNDYGELTTLMYLVLGQPLVSSQVILLLPDRLIAKNADALPGRTHRYASMEDILRVVDAEEPAVVFLCSGYLFSIHQILPLDELERLVGALHDRGCRIVTTDPFVGVFSIHDPRTVVSIDMPEESRFLDLEKVRKVKEIQEERLRTEFSRSEQLLRRVPHLYPAFCYLPPHEGTATDARNISFFNDKLIWPELESVGKENGRSGNRPHWLFLLSQTDLDTQLMFEGSRFAETLARNLLDTLAAGRHPILIAPDYLIDSVIARMPTVDGVDILPFCPFNRLMSLLLSAEYAFYWNVVSHTILFRLFNRRPVILFDKGHLIRNVPAMYDRIISWYYQGWEPRFHDHRVPLTLETVSAWASGYQRVADRICGGFRRAPTPQQMVDKLISGDELAQS